MTDKLKPCPFCGGKPIIVYNAKRKNVYGNDIEGTAIGCENCNATIFYRSSRLAIKAWNMRVQPERKTGKWMPHKSIFGGLGERVYTCSLCDYNIGFHVENYCPNCGADMRGENDDIR